MKIVEEMPSCDGEFIEVFEWNDELCSWLLRRESGVLEQYNPYDDIWEIYETPQDVTDIKYIVKD